VEEKTETTPEEERRERAGCREGSPLQRCEQAGVCRCRLPEALGSSRSCTRGLETGKAAAFGVITRLPDVVFFGAVKSPYVKHGVYRGERRRSVMFRWKYPSRAAS